jgi:hypothetical protein
MKKIALALGLALGVSFGAQANRYKIDEVQLAQTFEKSQEVSFDEMYDSKMNFGESTKMKAGDSKTRGGYLVRSFFCGGIALHRYYMGLNDTKNWMWAFYFCVPVAGWVDNFVDFWWVVIDKDAMSKYENNDAIFVWLD